MNFLPNTTSARSRGPESYIQCPTKQTAIWYILSAAFHTISWYRFSVTSILHSDSFDEEFLSGHVAYVQFAIRWCRGDWRPEERLRMNTLGEDYFYNWHYHRDAKDNGCGASPSAFPSHGLKVQRIGWHFSSTSSPTNKADVSTGKLFVPTITHSFSHLSHYLSNDYLSSSILWNIASPLTLIDMLLNPDDSVSTPYKILEPDKRLE